MGGVLVDDTPGTDVDAPVLRSGDRHVLELSGEATPIRILLRDVFRSRRLIPMLAAKDFSSRYRSASLGVLWSVMLPLLQGAVMALVFSRVARIRLSGQDDFKIYVVSGTLTWAYLSSVLGQGSTSIVDQGGVAGKVYFPRLILPMVPAATNLISLGISYLVLFGLMLVFHSPFHVTLLLLPVAVIVLAVLGVSLAAVSTMGHVYFRDVKYIVSAILVVALYATPILYPLSALHGWVRALIIANPASGAIQLVHLAVFGHADVLARSLMWTFGWTLFMLIVMLVVYRRYERVACDRL